VLAAIAAIVVGCVFPVTTTTTPTGTVPPSTGGSLDYGRASVRGKYETILKTFSVPADKDRYGDLYDLGYQDRTAYGTNRNLTAGYWVYAYPYWYIWEDMKSSHGPGSEPTPDPTP